MTIRSVRAGLNRTLQENRSHELDRRISSNVNIKKHIKRSLKLQFQDLTFISLQFLSLRYTFALHNNVKLKVLL